MSLKRRQFTPAFKLRVLREIEAGKSVAQAAREHQLHPNLIRQWRKHYRARGEDAFTDNKQTDQAKIAELERLIGQLTIENAFKKRLDVPGSHSERRQMTRAIEEATRELGRGQVRQLCQAQRTRHFDLDEPPRLTL